MMTELRLDPTIRNWVIVAPERSKRPDAFLQMSDGEGGFLVSREEDWVPRIDALLSDADEARRIGGLGRERVRQHFLITRLLEDELGLLAGVRAVPETTPS